jgi:hypothetical protein
MSAWWLWANEHWFIAAILMYGLMELVLRLPYRMLRTINIICRGWPTQPLMDADGDIVHPEKDEDEKQRNHD